MRILLEATDVTQDLLIDFYKHKVRISEATESCNGWLDLVLEGSEINLLKIYLKYWCEPKLHEYVTDFQQLIVKD